MLYGHVFLPMILSMHMSSVLLSYVPTVSVGGYFLGSLPIPLIIRKSVSILFYVAYQLIILDRIILATIKYLGQCLCPLCTCLMEKVRDLGTKADDTRRNNIRVDSEMRQGMIATAREWIFKKGRSITSKAIDRLLNFSMVPIRVSSSQNLGVSATNVPIECVLGSPLQSRIQLLSNVCCRSLT